MNRPALDEIKAAILAAAGPGVTGTAKVLDKVDARFPGQTDNVRYAYWVLVNEGRLIRGPQGVKLGPDQA